MCCEEFLRFQQQFYLSVVFRDRSNAPLVSLICGLVKKPPLFLLCGCLNSFEKFMSFSVQPKSTNLLSLLA